MPIPEKFLSNCAARHERVLSSIVLAFTSKSPTGSALKASKPMPAQLSWIVFPAKASFSVADVDAPRAARDVVADDLRVGGFLAYHDSPRKPERLISLERIFVAGAPSTSTPTQLPTKSFPSMVVSRLPLRFSMANWPSG